MSVVHKTSKEYLAGGDSSSKNSSLSVLFEDNHLLIVYKPYRMLTQADETGDFSLLELAKVYLKKKYQKPGNVFLGVTHRLDRPASGIVIFGKTSKGASRVSEVIRDRKIKKIYRVEVEGKLQGSGTLTHFLSPGEEKIFVSETPEKKDSKKGVLKYVVLETRKNTSLLEVELLTGRKHQIRAQLSFIGHPIVGDKRYGSKERYETGCIKLVFYSVGFKHPTKEEEVALTLPDSFLDWAKTRC